MLATETAILAIPAAFHPFPRVFDVFACLRVLHLQIP